MKTFTINPDDMKKLHASFFPLHYSQYNDLYVYFFDRFLTQENALSTFKELNKHNLGYIIDNLSCIVSSRYTNYIGEKTTEYYAYLNNDFSVDDYINVLSNVVKVRKSHSFSTLPKAEQMEQERKLHLFFEKYISPNVFENYVQLVNNKLMLPIDYLARIKRENLSARKTTKKYFNYLVDLTTHTKDAELLPYVSIHYDLLNKIDPLFKNVKIEPLFNLLKNEFPHNQVAQKLLHKHEKPKDDFLLFNENTFKVSLDIEAISILKKDKMAGKVFIEQLYNYFLYEQNNNNSFFQSFISKQTEIENLKNTNKIYNNTQIAMILKDFEFSYVDDNDKKIKQDILQDFLHAAIKLPIDVNAYKKTYQTEYKDIFDLIFLKHNMEKNMEEKSSSIKRNKI